MCSVEIKICWPRSWKKDCLCEEYALVSHSEQRVNTQDLVNNTEDYSDCRCKVFCNSCHHFWGRFGSCVSPALLFIHSVFKSDRQSVLRTVCCLLSTVKAGFHSLHSRDVRRGEEWTDSGKSLCSRLKFQLPVPQWKDSHVATELSD